MEFRQDIKDFVKEMMPHYTRKQVRVAGVDLDSQAYLDMLHERRWSVATIVQADREIRLLLRTIGEHGFSVLD